MKQPEHGVEVCKCQLMGSEFPVFLQTRLSPRLATGLCEGDGNCCGAVKAMGGGRETVASEVLWYTIYIYIYLFIYITILASCKRDRIPQTLHPLQSSPDRPEAAGRLQGFGIYYVFLVCIICICIYIYTYSFLYCVVLSCIVLCYIAFIVHHA